MASGVSEDTIAWKSVGQRDLAAVGVATCVDVAVALLLLHVLANRTWPPYRASIPTLLACTAFTVSAPRSCLSLRYLFVSVPTAYHSSIPVTGIGVRTYRRHTYTHIDCAGSLCTIPPG